MKIPYEVRAFRPSSVRMIEQANEIVAEYQAAGFALTLRQLYYQFVARGLLRNRQTEYKRLGAVVNDARLAGLIDWTAIEDRTRSLRGGRETWLAEDVIRAAPDMVTVDPWAEQPNYVEVWIEKDALLGVIEGVCNELAVPFFSCRGYTSQSELWRAAMRHVRKQQSGKRSFVLHLGDHDPSGIDMTRDITDRLELFCEAHGTSAPDVLRLALNMDQVVEHQPPPNPAKLTDSRAMGYISLHGDESWELDALQPQMLADLIRETVTGLLDPDLWGRSQALEAEERDRLRSIADRWDEIGGE